MYAESLVDEAFINPVTLHNRIKRCLALNQLHNYKELPNGSKHNTLWTTGDFLLFYCTRFFGIFVCKINKLNNFGFYFYFLRTEMY